jgi:outer membrane protein OmpA-like peptidoglycan-associated protein
MKKILLFGLTLAFSATAFAQDLPTNAEPGKCYVRCTTPDVWKNEDVTIQTAPSYKILKAHGPQFTTENITVETKQASSTLSVVPAKYQTNTESVMTKEASTRLVLVPGKTDVVTETIVTQEASTRLEIIPAVYENRSVEVVIQPASSRTEIVPAVYENRTVEVVTKPASTRLVVVPAEWSTETLTYVKSVSAPSLKISKAEFTNSSQTIVTKNASARWVLGDKAPDCESSDPNDCRVWCYRNVPEQSVTVPVQELAKNAAVITVPCTGGNGGADCAKNGTYTRRILVKPATTREIVVPQETKTFKTTVMVKPPSTRTIVIPQKMKTIKTVVMVKPPSTREITIPAVTKTYKKTIITPATTKEVVVPSVSKNYKKTVMTTPPSTTSAPIKAQFKTFKKTVLAKSAWTTETPVDAKHRTVTKEILVSKGGLTSWKEVDCKLTENSPLPINWNLGSATLTSKAKSIIDNRLMPVLNSGVSIEVASHTDSRGGNASNQRLSERRAQAVVNYLINKKGVNASRLVAKGYGEERLTNRCSDGVTCTEKEHRDNRRTTFRVINN